MKWTILLTALVPATIAQCAFRNGSVSSMWMVKGKTITVEFFNDNIGNERWTGIAFGESMHDLEIVVGTIHQNKTSLATGFTYGYGWVALDPVPVVQEKLLSYRSKHLRFAFTRPLGKHGPRNHSLEGCQTWNFMKEGDIVAGQVFQHSKPLPVSVCPEKCTSKILRKGMPLVN